MSATSERTPRTQARAEPLCVLWHPRDHAPDAALLESLRKKGLRTISCDNPVEAAAWLCTMGGKPALAKVGGAPNTTLRPMVLLLDRPAHLLGAADMLASMSRYAPAAVCWVHDPAASPRLRVVPPNATTTTASPPVAAMEPVLRLAGQDPDGGTEAVLDPASPDPQESIPQVVTLARTPRDMLSDEELAMLLGDVPSPEQPPHSFR